MCQGVYRLPTVVVTGDDDFENVVTEFQLTQRREFILYANHVRFFFQLWFDSMLGGIPVVIYKLIMRSDWDDFIKFNALDISNVMLILCFLEVNQAPGYIRRLFWTWLLPIPVFDRHGFAHEGHPYIQLYQRARETVDWNWVEFFGGYFNVSLGYDVSPQSYEYWMIFNIWNCRGWIEEPVIEL